MTGSLLATEPQLRLIVFLGVLVAMALWELAAPRRRREIPRVIRWTNNLGLVVIDTIVLRLSFPILAVGLAVIAQDRLRGTAQCHSDVQPFQYPAADACGPFPPLDRGHARYAPRPPFDHTRGDKQQFWLQPSLVGQAAWDLQGAAKSGPRGNVDRDRAIQDNA